MFRKTIIAILISFALFTACKKKMEVKDGPPVLLKYKFKEGQTYNTSVTSIVHHKGKKNPTKVRFDFLTKYTDVMEQGEKAKLKYTFEKLEIDGKVTKPMVNSMELKMDKTGTVEIQIKQLRNFQTTITFADKEVKQGDTWQTSLTAPVQSKNYQVDLTAKFKGYVKYKGNDAVLITYEGTKDGIKNKKDNYKVTITGKKIFDHKRGIYLLINSNYRFFVKSSNKWDEYSKIQVKTKLHE